MLRLKLILQNRESGNASPNQDKISHPGQRPILPYREPGDASLTLDIDNLPRLRPILPHREPKNAHPNPADRGVSPPPVFNPPPGGASSRPLLVPGRPSQDLPPVYPNHQTSQGQGHHPLAPNRPGLLGARPGQPPHVPLQPRRVAPPPHLNAGYLHRLDPSRTPTPVPKRMNEFGLPTEYFERKKGPLPDFPIGVWDPEPGNKHEKKFDPFDVLRDFTRNMQINKRSRRETPPKRMVFAHERQRQSIDYSHQNIQKKTSQYPYRACPDCFAHGVEANEILNRKSEECTGPWAPDRIHRVDSLSPHLYFHDVETQVEIQSNPIDQEEDPMRVADDNLKLGDLTKDSIKDIYTGIVMESQGHKVPYDGQINMDCLRACLFGHFQDLKKPFS